MAARCSSCFSQYPAPDSPAAPAPRYPEVVSDPLIGPADTPGSVRRLTALREPVQIKPVPGFALSSSVHTPDGPLRVTQSNIGKYLVASSDPSQTQRMTDTRVEDRNLDKMAVSDEACWADKPGKNDPLLFCVKDEYSVPLPFNPFASHQNGNSAEYDGQRLPCPVGDSSNDRHRIQDTNYYATDHEEEGAYKLMCDCQPQAPCCVHEPRKTFARCQVSPSENPVPFWWGGSPSLERGLTVGDMDHYARLPVFNEHDAGQDLMKTLLLDTRERYLPGQVYCDERRKIHGVGNLSYTLCRPPPPLTVEQLSANQMADERATCEQRPWSLPYHRDGGGGVGGGGVGVKTDCREVQERTPAARGKCRPCEEVIEAQNQTANLDRIRCEELHKEHMFKVGQPFKSAACRWYHQLYPPQPAGVIGRTPTRVFPHTRLTNI